MKIGNFKLGIGIPLNFPMIPDAFFDSFITMEKPDFVYLRSSKGDIDAMRDHIVQQAIGAGCSHLIMMDSDQLYHRETIPRLLSHKLPIVGCLVHRRYPPFDPLMLKGAIGEYQTIDRWEPGALVEVDATGTGCLMFHMDVFSKMPEPWFKSRTFRGGAVGEDIGFCSDLKKAGYRIFVDTSVPAGHLTSMVVNEWTWRLYKRLKEAEQYEMEHGNVITK